MMDRATTSTPLVSVLIPVYNRSTLISACIRSALEQTYRNIEVVIVDNASDDGTWDICREFAASDSRVRIFRNITNIGPVNNWRRAASEARGQYCKLLFSDDLLMPQCVEKMVGALHQHNVAFVYCPTYIGRSVESACVHYSQSRGRSLTPREFTLQVMAGAAPVSPGAVLFRAADLCAALKLEIRSATPRGYDRHGAGPDVLLALDTARRYPRITCLDVPLVFFRSHPGSLSVRNENNEIAESYVSAISFFLRRSFSWPIWSGYVGGKWLSLLRNKKRWIDPRSYFRMHEGRGTLLEVMCGTVVALGLILWTSARYKREGTDLV